MSPSGDLFADITTDLLFDMFDVPEEEGLGSLLHAARQAHYTLPYLALSVLDRDGHTIGPAAAEVLARARRRARHYERVLERVSAQTSVTAMKGPSLSHYYPAGVLRPQGDLDLVVPDEAELWRAARILCEKEPHGAWVTLFGAPERHLAFTLTWDAEEPLLDPQLKVELLTAALLGDFDAVPVRVRPPRDRLLSNLVCLAEERLQRDFHPRDALDLYAMSRHPLPTAAELVETADRYRLAPEIIELVRYAEDLLPIGRFAHVAPVLAEAAEEERQRRGERTPAPTVSGTRYRLRQGMPVHGMLLGRTSDSPDRTSAEFHWYGEEALLLTPLGDYLLVGDPLVSPDRHAAAVEERNRLASAAGTADPKQAVDDLLDSR